MMKVVSAILLAAAFAYAVTLVILRRRAPDPATRTGWRRHFFVAVALFVTGLGGVVHEVGKTPGGILCYTSFVTCYEAPPVEVVMCYDRKAPETQPAAVRDAPPLPGFLQTLSAAWRALTDGDNEAERLEEVKARCADAVAAGDMTPREAKLFEIAYQQAAFHYRMTRRGHGRYTTCYDMALEGVALQSSAEALWQRLEALRAARAAGALDEATARMALKDIGYAVGLMRLFAYVGREDEAMLRTAEEVQAAMRALNVSCEPDAASGGRRDVVELPSVPFDEATQRVAEWILRLEGAAPPPEPPASGGGTEAAASATPLEPQR